MNILFASFNRDVRLNAHKTLGHSHEVVIFCDPLEAALHVRAHGSVAYDLIILHSKAADPSDIENHRLEHFRAECGASRIVIYYEGQEDIPSIMESVAKRVALHQAA